MPVDPTTRQSLDDHLGQAEFALRVAAHFDCLKGTPANETVRAALARVEEARGWVREKLDVHRPTPKADVDGGTVAERRRTIHQRMARFTP
jgi:hypothetical protein